MWTFLKKERMKTHTPHTHTHTERERERERGLQSLIRLYHTPSNLFVYIFLTMLLFHRISQELDKCREKCGTLDKHQHSSLPLVATCIETARRQAVAVLEQILYEQYLFKKLFHPTDELFQPPDLLALSLQHICPVVVRACDLHPRGASALLFTLLWMWSVLFLHISPVETLLGIRHRLHRGKWVSVWGDLVDGLPLPIHEGGHHLSSVLVLWSGHPAAAACGVRHCGAALPQDRPRPRRPLGRRRLWLVLHTEPPKGDPKELRPTQESHRPMDQQIIEYRIYNTHTQI